MKFVPFLFILFLPVTLLSQNSRVHKLLSADRISVDKIEIDESETVLFIPGEFAKEKIDSEKIAKRLNEATVIKVYYVYTQYKLSPSFNQLSLDKKRFNLLNENFPFLITDPLIEWEIIEQSGCRNPKEGQNYFHGFIVIHRPLPSKENREKEIELIDNFFENMEEVIPEPELDPLKKQIENVPDDKQGSESSEKTDKDTTDAEFVGGDLALYRFFQENLINSHEVRFGRRDKWIDMEFDVDEDGRISNIRFKEEYPQCFRIEVKDAFDKMPDWVPAYENRKAVKATVNLQIRVSYSSYVKGMYTRDYETPDFSDDYDESYLDDVETKQFANDARGKVIQSTGVYRSLDTLLISGKAALVVDVTGSMTSHIGATIYWISRNLNNNPFSSYTFFNDGDGKETRKKKIGRTGGIYHIKEHEEIKETIKTAMRNGNGGERSESDIEALLLAQDHDPDCDVIVLIGDNYSEVRDLKLVKHLTKPVIIIPCAAPKSVRADYLNIAKQTGGYMILNGKIVELQHIQKGDKFFCQEGEYKFDGKNFVQKN